jgi:branched-chain amino acid aminotransferase
VTAAPAAPGRVPNDAARPLIWIDGRLVDASDAGISPLDRGFTLADGLFETMRAYHGTVFRLDAHLRRLAAGAAILGIPVPADVPHMVAAAAGAVRDLGWADAALRLTMTRGVGPRGLAPPVGVDPTAVLTASALPPREPLPARSVRVCTATARRNEFAATAGVKTLAYVESVVALAHAHTAGDDDAIFLDTAGHVCEATSSNVFVVAGATLRTPPRECGVLPGITRAVVLELAGAMGLAAREDVIAPHDLAGADEAFLTSSIRELAPIAGVDGAQLPNGAPGPVTRRIAQAFAELVERECRP